ncbi:MAG: hypothetical protein DRP71_09355 [Verrucomicrobia bacterium]|nr:MAG: hypothetical protein DRP71_09355 [Verrucomicrobiota bacterium]
MTRYQIHHLLVLVFISVLTTATTHASQAIRLFEGENLDQWVIENDGQFVAEDGLLKLNGGTGWLRSKDTFDDYTLVVEFRFLEEGANSGIFVRTGPTSNDDGKGWPNDGYQVQCMDTTSGETPLATLILYGAPPFEQESDLEALERAYRPTGEWHRFEITCRGEKLTVKLNDETITRCTGIKKLNGHVGIQGEHGRLEFRRVTVITFPKRKK